MTWYKIITAGLCLFCATASSAQQDNSEIIDPITLEKLPAYPGGEKEMLAFIHQNVRWPVFDFDAVMNSRVVVRFTVTQTGDITHPEVLRDPCKGCGDAVIKVLQSMPCWIPGELDGKKVAVRYILPIRLEWD